MVMNTCIARLVCLSILLTAQVLPAQSNDLVAQTRSAMSRATDFIRSISEEGGYLWKYSADMSKRAGEELAPPTQVWVQPPGTPSEGMIFLRAYSVTKDAKYLDA